MSIVRDPVARARSVKTELQAARLYQSIEPELALNDELPAGWEDEADQALAILRDRFDADLSDPDLAAGPNRERGTGKTWMPGYSRGASAGPHEGRRRAGAPKRTTTTTRSSSPKPARTGGKRKPARRFSSRRAGRALERTGLPGAADSATGMTLWLVGVTVGLTLIYVLIRGNGPRAVQIASGSLTTGLRVFLAPTDPLRPTAKAAARGGPAPGNAYERGIANGRLAGPPAPGLAPRLNKPTTHTKVIPR